jgi:hypothetical protein
MGLSQDSEGLGLIPEDVTDEASIRAASMLPPAAATIPAGTAPAVTLPGATPIPAPRPGLSPGLPTGPIVEGTSVGSTKESLSQPQIQDFAALDKIRGAQENAQKALTGANVADAGEDKKAADAALEEAQRAEIARQKAIEEAQRRRLLAEAEVQERLDHYNKQDFHTFFSDRPKAAEVLTDIGLALGAFGAAGRGQNEAAQILQNRVASDFELQKARIEKAKDSYVMAKAKIADADEARRILLDDVDLRNAAALGVIKAKLVAGKMAQGQTRAQAEGDKAVADIDQQIQQLKEKTTSSMANKTTFEEKKINPEAEAIKAGIKNGPKEDLADVFDKNGKFIGRVTSGKGGAQAFMTRDAQYSEAIQKAEQLLADVKKNKGTNVIDTSRKSLIDGAIGAAATVSPMGKTVEAMHIEAGTMGIRQGPAGTSYVNPDALRNRIAQMKETQQNYRTQGLIPPTQAQSDASDARRAASPVTKAPKLSIPDSDVKALKTLAASNDPRAAEAQKILKAAGKL